MEMRIVAVFLLGRLSAIRPSESAICETCATVTRVEDIERHAGARCAVIVCVCGSTRFVLSRAA